MILILGFFVELFILFILSKSLITLLFRLFYVLSRSKKFSIYLMSLLFLPGTLIHELSHYIMSMILQVPVGEMELFPKEVANGIKLGSVQVAKTDPIRRMLIGMAPFLFGVSIILGTFLYATQNNLFGHLMPALVIGYIVFEIGNTMFSSKKDMEGFFEIIATIVFFAIVFYLVGFRIPSLNPEIIFANKFFQEIFKKANLYLLFPIGIDAVLIIILKLFKH